MTVDIFASVRDGYTLETITFAFDGLTPTTHGNFECPPNQLGTYVTAHCPHDEPFGAFISLSREAFNDPNFFSELVRMVDCGAETVMKNGCDNHDKKSDQ